MRWPNRKPHTLTAGMRKAQAGLAAFLPLIDWSRFRRCNLNEEVRVSMPEVACCASGDEDQAIVWLVRKDTIGGDGLLRRDAPPITPHVLIPGLRAGRYRVSAWDTLTGSGRGSFDVVGGDGPLAFWTPPFATDLALAIGRI
jgi:mannan endo-1,4-beta-mannosidase